MAIVNAADKQIYTWANGVWTVRPSVQATSLSVDGSGDVWALGIDLNGYELTSSGWGKRVSGTGMGGLIDLAVGAGSGIYTLSN